MNLKPNTTVVNKHIVFLKERGRQMNEVGFSDEYKALKLRYAALRERVANQIEMFTHLVEVVGPNMKAQYMMLVGQLEHRVYELKTEENRWKRRFALRQQYLNRGEKPDFMAIEAELDKEFAEYLAEVKKHIEEIKEASLRFHAGKLSKKEASDLRCAYLDAVKKLHPDINPGLPQAAIDLWNQIQKAYEEQDWDKVKFLASLVDGVVSGDVDFAASPDGMAALKESCARLEAKSQEIAQETQRVKSTVPFTYEVLLEDEDLVSERQGRLNAQIAALEERVKEYEELWNNGK